MHYNRNSFAVNSSYDTLEPKPAYSQYLNIMGQQFDPVLSAADRAGMAAIYGAGPALSAVVTNTQDSGAGSLRAALYYAFDHPGTTVSFNIPTTDAGFSNHVFNIQPTDRFPSLVHATVLDGSTEPTNSNPNGPSILLNGALAPPPSVFPDGLRLGGSNCAVRSLIINGFAGSGVIIDGAGAMKNAVTGCYLGLDTTGTSAVTNGYAPLTIDNGASSNTIGGLTASARNIISGSYYQGVVIRDGGTKSNVLEGNYIGLNATGTAAVSNAWSGVAIFNGAQSNVIGGTLSAMRNIISGNGDQGVVISDPGTMGNVVEGNYIGLSPAGTAAISNGWAGVSIFNQATFNTIGGTASATRNIISGNGLQGVTLSDPGTQSNSVQGNYIGLNPAGTGAIPNGWAGVDIFGGARFNVIGGTGAGAGNVISGNTLQGVSISQTNTTGNTVAGNFIGVNPAGTAAVANGWSGVQVFFGAQSNVIGGTVVGAGNLISGNGNAGVTIDDPGTGYNVVEGNYIGLNLAGTAAIGNGWAGVYLFGGTIGNRIGGVGVGNVISGNGNQGVVITDSGTVGTVVAGNIIGLNALGTAAVPNTWEGVALYNQAQFNVIGGTTPGTRNTISGNGNQGVALADANTSGNTIAGNYIGLDVTGSFAISNAWVGIDIFGGAQNNTVGGGVGARNVISGNGNDGVSISGSSPGNIVQGNSIGLNAAGAAAVPNAYGGVTLFGGAQGNQIGGTALGQANLIAYNLSDGVRLFDSTTFDNSIRGNSIFANSGSGIALYTSANNSSSPLSLSLTSAVLSTNTTISGTLSAAHNSTFHLDFYANPPPGPSPQAATWLGSKDVVTGSGGSVGFAASLGAIVPIAYVITATATDVAGNTSQLATGTTVTATDSVHDGIPDAWRKAHFGGTGTTTNSLSCAVCDPDHDGRSNWQEFLSGTDPNSAASVLRVAGLTVNGPDIIVNFQSVQGITYRVDTRAALGAGTWSILADQILGTGGLLQVTHPGVATLPAGFYRVDALP